MKKRVELHTVTYTKKYSNISGGKVKKKIDIIGGGIAGLSAGCYLQMNDYDTTIYEMQNLPGGVCTAWSRRGYTFDGCIHWVVGSKPSDDFYFLWNELIDMKNKKFYDFDIYARAQGESKEQYIDFFTDINRLEEELLKKAPEDEKPIKEMTKTVRKFIDLKLPVFKAREVMGFSDGMKLMLKLLPFLRDMKKWGSISGKDFSEQFKNPILKDAIKYLFIPEMSFLFMIFTFAWMTKKSAGYPLGGSLQFSKDIARRYKKLGGTIKYNSKVLRIKDNAGRANGLIMESGEETKADMVISAADGFTTIFNMLDGKFTNKKISNYYKTLKTFPSFIQVSLGIKRTFKDIPGQIWIPLEEEFQLDPETSVDHTEIRIFNFDDSLAPDGSTSVTILFPTYNYEYWENLRKNDMKKYREEKNRIGKKGIDILEKRFGNINRNIEVVDVSTPSTFIRYTGNWKGSFEGWILTPDIALKQMDKTLPGLKDFYMIGQWVEPGGGVPAVLMSGRNVAQIICKKDKKEFETISF